MGTKHTPGPWIQHDKASMAILGKNGFLVANCGGHFDSRRESGELEKEHQANARLIAAAPELLEALTAMVETHYWDQEFPAFKQARAAIHKATGEQA